MVVGLFNQYSTAEPLLKGLPQWVGELDAKRIASYQLYEQIYWNVQGSLQLIPRGSDEKPIYIPSAKVIVETAHRFFAPQMDVIIDEATSAGSETELAEANSILVELLRRERWSSRFSSAKRYGLIRGDWLIHIDADPTRPEGSRLMIYFIDPASYFPVYSDDYPGEQIAAHLVEQMTIDGTQYIKRLTYRKDTERGGPSPITVTDELYEVDKWGGPGIEQGSPLKTITPPFQLPSPIDQIPIYHIRNFAEDTPEAWGSSEIRGLERLIQGINQGISDEELALALEGLGVYVTTAGEPVDEDGQPIAWNLGPARVIELPPEPNMEFKRVQGVSNVEPYQSHLKYLENWINRAASAPEIAQGRVDVQVAESGVALLLEMGPLLAHTAEKELIVTDVLNNFLFDLKKWLAAYERSVSGGVFWIPSYGDKLPVNRKQRFEEIMKLLQANPPVVSGAWARRELVKIGYEFPDDTAMMQEILSEREVVGLVEADAFGARIDRELQGITEGQGGAGDRPAPAGAGA